VRASRGIKMLAMIPIGVTGASGRLGGGVARRLHDAGVAQRLIVRDARRAPSLPGADVAEAEFADGPALIRALRGLQTVLMVSASESPDRVARHRSFIDAAVAAGVRHLVYTSFVGAAADATFTLARDHWATEEHLRGSGIDTTVLRDNLYADFVEQLVGDDGVLAGPAGHGRAALVAQDDIADAAVAVLVDPERHRGRTYSLTGPESLDFFEVARTLTDAGLGPVVYRPETPEEAYASRARFGAPDWQVDAWVSTYLAVAAGELAEVTGAIPHLTGHEATSLEALLRRGG
jgi:uncharacterized protein YbjT (DUF2867 family)